jgi:hypothetical protein
MGRGKGRELLTRASDVNVARTPPRRQEMGESAAARQIGNKRGLN